MALAVMGRRRAAHCRDLGVIFPPLPDLPVEGVLPVQGVDFPLRRDRRADWKVASRRVNMARLLLLGAHPSGVYMGNPGQSISA
jgi:hypothetical protein